MDSVYDATGAAVVQPPSGGFRSRDIGTGIDVSAKYLFTRYLVLNAGVGHFAPGAVMAANQHGAPLTIGYLSLTYRFMVAH
jgi:hypothetical protein